MNLNHFTPSQKSLLQVLQDGMLHSPEELVSFLKEDLGGNGLVQRHISYLRPLLRKQGYDIVYYRKDRGYQLTRLLVPTDDGKR